MSDKAIEVIAGVLKDREGLEHWSDEGCAGLVLDALKAARIAVVELPESQPSGIIGQVEWPVESRDTSAAVMIQHDGKIISDGISSRYLTPQHARSHAAALLAAAEAVES